MGEGQVGFKIKDGKVVTAKKLKDVNPLELSYLIICMELEIQELKKNFIKIENEN